MANERGKILDEAKATINGHRQDMYGNPEDSFKKIAAFWSDYVDRQIVFTEHDVAVMMALMKVARICTGSGGRDSYVDMCGYAALAADIMEKRKC